MTTASQAESLSGRVRTVLYGVPVDLVVVSVVAAVVAVAILDFDGGYSLVRALAGFVLVLVLPGYALVAAVFPGRSTGSFSRRMRDTDAAYSPGSAERLVLSFVCSLALIPILAVLYGLFGTPFEPSTTVSTIAVVVLVLSALAAVHRFTVPPADRYNPSPLFGLGERTRDWITAGTTTDTALSLVLVLAVLLAVSTVAFGLLGPTRGGAYTSVSLVTKGPDGGYVASHYPTNFTAGRGENLTLQVENDYRTAANYTAIVELQRVRGQGTNSIDLVERERVATVKSKVPANGTWTRTHTVVPTMTGTDLRLMYYVYRGDAPNSPTVDSADETVHLWVTVHRTGTQERGAR